MTARQATPADAAGIAHIYNAGIEDRIATFETSPRTADDVRKWFDGSHPIVVVEDGGEVIAFGATFPYRPRSCYDGIAETMVYVARNARRRGAGRMALDALLAEAERQGFWKLVSRIFPDNTASLALIRAAGFREVGIYEKHGQLDGEWKDVVIVERLLAKNLA
ncbi:MAG: N-acetyltransferase [bacterium]|nr:N-acetyltransferase [bacterium]